MDAKPPWTWSVAQFVRFRVWRPFLLAGKGATWIAGLIAAVTAIVLWLPQAVDQVWWREAEYGKLASVHAGDNAEHVDAVFGTPTIVKGVDATPGLIVSIYVRRDHYVMTVSNEARRVLLYSVLSCHPAFSPSFTTPIGSTVRLRGESLAHAESASEGEATADADLGRRNLAYVPGVTGSSLDQAIEEGVQSGSNAARTQSWFLGVNGVCASADAVPAIPAYAGPAEGAPQDVRELRESTPADFYAETATEVPAVLGEDGSLQLGAGSSAAAVWVSPHAFDLPRRPRA